MSDDAIITKLELLRKYLEDKLNMSAYINPDGKYIRVIYGGISVCKIFTSGDGYNVEYSDSFLMGGCARKEQYICLERDIPVFIRNRIDFYEEHTNKKGQKNMTKLEELREYLNQKIGDIVTVIYDRATSPYSVRDRIRIKRNGWWVCSIYDTRGSVFNVVFYDPFTCKSAGFSPVVNLTLEEVPKIIKSRINICDSTIINNGDNRIAVDIDVSDEAIEKQIYMMTARGSGKTRWISEMFKNSFPFKDHIKDVIFNDPATIVFWTDGSKTVVKCQPGETFDPEKGLAMAISKKVLGNDYGYYETFAKYVGRYNKKKGKKNEKM